MAALNEEVIRRVRERLAARGLGPGDLAAALRVAPAVAEELLGGGRIWNVDEIETTAALLSVEPEELFPLR